MVSGQTQAANAKVPSNYAPPPLAWLSQNYFNQLVVNFQFQPELRKLNFNYSVILLKWYKMEIWGSPTLLFVLVPIIYSIVQCSLPILWYSHAQNIPVISLFKGEPSWDLQGWSNTFMSFVHFEVTFSLMMTLGKYKNKFENTRTQTQKQTRILLFLVGC